MPSEREHTLFARSTCEVANESIVRSRISRDVREKCSIPHWRLDSSKGARPARVRIATLRGESMLSSLEDSGAGDAYGIRITRALLGSLVESLSDFGPTLARVR